MLFFRSLVFNIFLYVFTALCSIVAMLLAASNPRRLPTFAQWWSRTWLAFYRKICGVSYAVRGQENIPAGGCIIAMKHQSTWDTFALFAIFPEPVFVFKAELAFIPIFGMALKHLKCIAVKRGTGKIALDSMIQGTAAAIAQGKQVVVFPEGTRAAIDAPATYKTGVSHVCHALQVSCIPVALNSGLLWPKRKFLRPPGTVTVEILPAVPPGMQRKEIHSYLANEIETASRKLCKSSD